MACDGITTNVEIGDEKNQKDYYDKATHYDHVWGEDNIHLGYYPHIASKELVKFDNVQAADMLTKHMIDVGKIDHKSKVLDLGCGKGQSCRVIAEHTGADCTGIDLSTNNIVRANEVAKQRDDLTLTFYEGSFTELPKEVLAQKYSHIFSQVAFCHVHSMLPLIFEEAQKVLAPGGVLIVNDYMGGKKKPSTSTRENVHKRLHFEHLHTHKEWRRIAEESGFVIENYEDLDKHMAQTYRDMEIKARKLGFKSTDGALLADNYKMTYTAIEAGEIGMNMARMSVGLPLDPDSLVSTSNVYVTKDGVSARRNIGKGDIVECGVVKRLPKGFAGKDVPCVLSWSGEWAMGSGATMFYKGSDDPNCEMKKYVDEDRYEMVALCDIKEAEMLTVVA